MAHEIESNDQVVLTKRRAWHGLGIVVEDAPTPTEAFKLGGLDWTVEQRPVAVQDTNDQYGNADGWVANVRSDDNSLLAIVRSSFEPIQNLELAEFAEALNDQGQVKVETVGTIRGGRKVWALCKTETMIDIAKGDQIQPYVLLSNGHDGSAAFRVTPTTVRVVCSNTLHAVIPNTEGADRSLSECVFKARHTASIKDRVAEARSALDVFFKGIDGVTELGRELAGKTVDRKWLESFWLEVYMSDFGKIDLAPSADDKTGIRRKQRALDAVATMARRFDREAQKFGANRWIAANAYTGWLQHERSYRGSKQDDAADRRAHMTLLGDDAGRTVKAFEHALVSA